jgi:hypothetical protein
VELNVYLEILKSNPKTENRADEIIRSIRAQEHSNLFYLPGSPLEGKEYIAVLDEMFWFPSDEFELFKQDLTSNRLASLDNFGFYLFVLKLSYHLCRLPEDEYRKTPAA